MEQKNTLMLIYKALRYRDVVKSQAEFGEKLGYKESFISKLLSGKQKFPDDLRKKLSKVFGENMDDWEEKGNINEATSIYTSEGPMKGVITHNPLVIKRNNLSGAVPYYDADFVAGEGISFFEDNVDRPAYTMQIPGYAGCVAFPAYGDSMENVIKGGSVLFGRKLGDWRSYLEYGQIYGVVMKDQRRFLKYIRRAEDSRNCLLLRSENEKYDDFEIPKNKVHNIWLIEGWMLKKA